MYGAISLTDRNLILSGYTGSNPARIGAQVAERLAMPFVNFDVLLSERAGLSGDEVRRYYGERRLKAVESDLVEEARLRRQTVVRVGARTLLHPEHLARLADTGPVIVLTSTLDAILRRIHISMGGRYADPNERARELGELRQEWPVRQLTGVLVLDVTDLDIPQTVEAVVNAYRERAITRA
jgi:shikimate kinase